jgi:hypothetical protein
MPNISPQPQTAPPKPRLKRKRTEPAVVVPPASTSASQPPPSKRSRTSGAKHQKHLTHWHLDGNVLVQINKTRFKLQRSRLAQHSEWFSHTFDQIDNGQELQEWDAEISVLYLDRTKVAVKDFVALLDAMDNAM